MMLDGNRWQEEEGSGIVRMYEREGEGRKSERGPQPICTPDRKQGNQCSLIATFRLILDLMLNNGIFVFELQAHVMVLILISAPPMVYVKSLLVVFPFQLCVLSFQTYGDDDLSTW